MSKYKITIEVEIDDDNGDWGFESYGVEPLEAIRDFVYHEGFDFDLTPLQREESIIKVEKL